MSTYVVRGDNNVFIHDKSTLTSNPIPPSFTYIPCISIHYLKANNDNVRKNYFFFLFNTT